MASPQLTLHNGFLPPASATGRTPEPAFHAEPVPSILLVTADGELASRVGSYLPQRRFALDTVADGTRGLAESLAGAYSLVIVDAVLPVLDGLGLIQELRTRSSVPVLLIGRNDEQLLAAQDAGADDFILNPVNLGELLARTRTLLRREEKASKTADTLIRCGDLTVNVKNHQAWLAEELLTLTNVEFAILKCLTRCAGRVVSRDELAAVLYQRKSTPFERSIDVHISHLRRKIERAGGVYIRTIRGIGYLLALSQ